MSHFFFLATCSLPGKAECFGSLCCPDRIRDDAASRSPARCSRRNCPETIIYKLSAMDVLVPNSMKDAANCDKQCELQKSVNHQTSERIRHSWDPFSECVWLSVSIFLIIYFSADVVLSWSPCYGSVVEELFKMFVLRNWVKFYWTFRNCKCTLLDA